MKRLAQSTLAACRKRRQKIATAESCTGGMVAAALTAIPGSSDVVDSGFVTYSNAAKESMLGVAKKTLEQFGAVSKEPVAKEMAAGALKHSNAQLAVSITGIAGPGGSEHKPEGRVCFGLALPKETLCCTIEFGGIGRDQVRSAAAQFALCALRDGQFPNLDKLFKK